MKVRESVEKYKTQSMHYLKNALHFIEVGDAEKASEFLWGSIAEAIKAVAASKGIQLKSHEDLRNYAMELTKVLRDVGIRNTFLHAQSLHSNFYETGLLMEDVLMCADDIRATLAKLFRLIGEAE